MESKKLLALAAGLSFLSAASASPLLQEGFNYTTGDNLGSGSTKPPWVASGSSAYMSIGSGNLTYNGLQDLGGGSLTLNSGSGSAISSTNAFSAVTSGSVYYSFLLECTQLPSGGNSYLTSLTAGTFPNGGTDPLALYSRNSGTGFQLGIRHSGVGSGATYESTVLTLNTIYFVVMEYTFGSGGQVNLFVNPVPGDAQPTATVSIAAGGTEAANLSAIGFKSQSAATVGNYIFDNLNVGTTWADVTPVPEPGTLALAGAGAALLVGLYRRQRK